MGGSKGRRSHPPTSTSSYNCGILAHRKVKSSTLLGQLLVLKCESQSGRRGAGFCIREDPLVCTASRQVEAQELISEDGWRTDADSWLNNHAVINALPPPRAREPAQIVCSHWPGKLRRRQEGFLCGVSVKHPGHWWWWWRWRWGCGGRQRPGTASGGAPRGRGGAADAEGVPLSPIPRELAAAGRGI